MAHTREPVDATVVLGERGATAIRVLDCTSGRLLAQAHPPAPLSTAVALAPDGRAVYAATATAQLLRWSLPGLQEQARGYPGFAANALAVSGGADAIVLAGGVGTQMLTALDRDTLATLHEYRLPEAAAVSTIIDVPARSRFTVGFSDLSEAWEIAYDRDAPPVLQGLVHDYRMREAVELPGRLTPRRFPLPAATRTIVNGALAHELLRVDTSGGAGVVNLDVRREIERPALGVVLPSTRIAAWQGASSRGWITANEGSRELRVLEAGSWRVDEPVIASGEVLALSGDQGAVLVALAQDAAHNATQNANTAIATFDVASRRWRTLSHVARTAEPPFRFVAGTAGCIALVDRDDRWLAGLRPETRAAVRNRGS